MYSVRYVVAVENYIAFLHRFFLQMWAFIWKLEFFNSAFKI